MVGETIVHYKLIEKLGAGGMGEIYKAEDPRLHRVVAVKILSPAISADPERRRRFLQEAQAASALNHPNIITVYDIVTEGKTQCIVMEYVAGKTMRDVIPPGGLPVPQALTYAVQMAGALSVAHAAGIVHRDLKPSNVMITPSGLVKILDFGLAKWLEPLPGTGTGEEPTVDQGQLTREGSIIGTVSYMSPEQAEGKRVDLRSDIFAFGSVLYEMLTGKRAFEGTSGISTLSAILRDEVKPIYEIAPDVPPLLEQIVLRCLPKDPDARWQSMKEVEGALSTLLRQLDPSGQYASPLSTTSLSGAPPAAAAPSLPPPSVAAGGAATRPSPAAPAPAAAPAAKGPKSPKPIAVLAGLLGILLVGSAAVGGLYFYTHQHPQPAPITNPQPPPAQPVNPPPAPVNPPVELNPPANEQPPVPEKAAPKQPAVAKKTTPKAGGKTTPPTTPPTNPPAQIAPISLPQPEKSDERKAPPATKQAVPIVTLVKVSDGLPFSMILAGDVPADAQEGLMVRFTVANNFQVDDKTVLAKGATVTGLVVSAAGKKKILGLGGGKITYQLQQAEAVDGKQLKVRATSGHNADGTSTHQFETPKGPKKKGFAAVQGTEYVGYIDTDQAVSVRK